MVDPDDSQEQQCLLDDSRGRGTVDREDAHVHWGEDNSHTDRSRTSPRTAVLHATRDDRATENPILFAAQQPQEAEAEPNGRAEEDSRSPDIRCRADSRREISRASSHRCQQYERRRHLDRA